jgi:hypothetical protein
LSGFVNGYYLDLRGRTVASFHITELMGRMPGGEPRWEIVCCRCSHSEVLPHSKLLPIVTSQGQLQCPNLTCASRTASDVETFEQFRKRERREAKAAAAQSAEAAKIVEAEAAVKQVASARLADLKAEYRTFWRHQFNTEAPEQIVPFSRWCELTQGTRQIVMDRIEADPTAFILNI